MITLEYCLEEAVADVLSSMCFAAPEFLGRGIVANPEGAVISFSGEVSGEMKIAVDHDLARQLTADFLGTSLEAVTPEQTRLFTMELANILCGTALSSSVAGKQYNLGLPESTPVTGECEYCFSVGGGEIDFGVQLEGIGQ